MRLDDKMPAVFTFWQLPEDESTFFDFLLTTGDIFALHDRGVRTKEEMVPVPLAKYAAQDIQSFNFGLEQFATKARVKEYEVEEQHYYKLVYGEPCLINYMRPTMDGRKLFKSNLAAYWEHLDDTQSTLLQKAPEFIEWRRKIFRWARQFAPKQVPFRGLLRPGTTAVKRALDEGKIELAQ